MALSKRLEHELRRWDVLVAAFALEQPGARPWQPFTLAQSYDTANASDQHAICFLLDLWGPTGFWRCGPFAVIEAFKFWDDHRRAVFLAWAEHPWWPR